MYRQYLVIDYNADDQVVTSRLVTGHEPKEKKSRVVMDVTQPISDLSNLALGINNYISKQEFPVTTTHIGTLLLLIEAIAKKLRG